MCDGEPDCAGGEDEDGCRVIASLFTREEGYKLEGEDRQDMLASLMMMT